MKVLEKGRAQKGWAKVYICTGKGNKGGGCGAKLLVEQGDLFKTCSSHYDGSTDYYVTFECIECKVFTDIEDTSDSPIRLRDLPYYSDKR